MRVPDRRSIVGSWRSGEPVVVWGIIVVCSVVWLVQTGLRILAPGLYSSLMMSTMFVPALVPAYPWSWLTSMFLHAPSILHVLFNMLTLWVVGPYLERALGHIPFLVMYLVSGLGGSVGILAWARITGQWMTASYGASGAIFGLFSAVLVAYHAMGEDIRSLVVWIAINLAIPFVVSNVAWQAHVGGLVAGAVLAWLMVSGVRSLRGRGVGTRMAVYGGALSLVLVAAGVFLIVA